MKVVPVTGDIVGLLSEAPSLDSCTSTISSERSDSTIAEFNSKVQIKVISFPIVTMSELLANMREDRGGTIQKFMHSMNSNQIIILLLTLNPDILRVDIHCYNISCEVT